jgi:hypothetical protein
MSNINQGEKMTETEKMLERFENLIKTNHGFRLFDMRSPLTESYERDANDKVVKEIEEIREKILKGLS